MKFFTRLVQHPVDAVGREQARRPQRHDGALLGTARPIAFATARRSRSSSGVRRVEHGLVRGHTVFSTCQSSRQASSDPIATSSAPIAKSVAGSGSALPARSIRSSQPRGAALAHARHSLRRAAWPAPRCERRRQPERDADREQRARHVERDVPRRAGAVGQQSPGGSRRPARRRRRGRARAARRAPARFGAPATATPRGTRASRAARTRSRGRPCGSRRSARGRCGSTDRGRASAAAGSR